MTNQNVYIKEHGKGFSGQAKMLRTLEPEVVDWIPQEDAKDYVTYSKITATRNSHTYHAPSGMIFDRVVVNVGDEAMPRKIIKENGTYDAYDEDVSGYKKVIVDVEPQGGVDLSATSDGEYTPEDGEFFQKVIVDVHEPLPPNPHPEKVAHKSVTKNGTYKASNDDLFGYDEVTVNIPSKEYKYSFRSLTSGVIPWQDVPVASCVINLGYGDMLCVFEDDMCYHIDFDGNFQDSFQIPFSSVGMSAITVNGVIHLIGGATYGGTMMHKISSDFGRTWSDSFFAPPANCICPNLVTDGLYIYMVGATDDTHSDAVTTDMYVYLTDIGIWGTAGSLPVSMYSEDEAVYYNGCIHIWKNNNHYFNNLRSLSWQIGDAAPDFFFTKNHNMCVYDDAVILINAGSGSVDTAVASYKETNTQGTGKYRTECWIPYQWFVAQKMHCPGQRAHTTKNGVQVFGCSGQSSTQDYVLSKNV